MTMPQVLPIERFYDLAGLSEAGDEIVIAPSREDLSRLTHWANIDSVERFEAKISLTRLSANRFAYDATLSADIVQSCVVTLNPVKSHIDHRFRRVLHLAPSVRRFSEVAGEIALSSADDEVPEEIGSPRFDLAGPILEEFVLAIDPYPRAPGVAFEPPAPEDAAYESPFAALKKLKMGD